MASYYVDPSIDSDSGAGTIGDPFGDLQYALDSIYHDTTNGDRINIKSGTAEVLEDALDFTTFGQVSLTGGLTIAGYTSSEDDGGIGEIDGDDTYPVIDFSTDVQAMNFIDMKMGNCGAYEDVLHMYRGIYLENCEIHTAGGHGIELSNHDLICWKCHFHNLGGNAVDGTNGTDSHCYDCFFEDGGTYQFTSEVLLNCGAQGCIFYNYTCTQGINVINKNIHPLNHNSFFPGGTKTSNGIYAGATGLAKNWPSFNLFENCNIGIRSPYSTYASPGIVGNAFYDCTTNFTSPYGDGARDVDNEALSASPFEKSGAATFANRKTYFAPADEGNVRTGGLTGGAKGAVAYTAAGGGGIQIARGMHGGIRG